MGQEGILLRLVEAVNLIDKEHHPPPAQLQLLGHCHRFTDLLDPGGDGRQPQHLGIDPPGKEFGQGGLAGAGRPPQDHRVDLARFQRPPQRLAGRQQMLLAGILIEGAGAHARRQRLAGGAWAEQAGAGHRRVNGRADRRP